jgi:hypothetical protein
MDVKLRTVRLLRIAVASGLCAFVLSPPAQARAADTIVAHDTLITAVYALDGDVVYYRRTRAKLPSRAWMRWSGGKLSRARAIPRRAWPGAIGRDAKGRKVFTFAMVRLKSGVLVSEKWFVYDIKRDRARRLHGLPRGCVTNWVSLWRHSMAYSAACKKGANSGVFVRQRGRTQKINSDPYGNDLVFRAGALVGVFDTGLDDFVVIQYMANGKLCKRVLDSSYGDATDVKGWYPSGLWIGNGSLTWSMGHWFARPNFALLSAQLPSGCATPGSVGQVQFTPKTPTLSTFAIDGRRIYYTDGKTLHLQTLPARPSFARPANDDFEHAEELPAEAPFVATARLAYATVQPGEPLAEAKHTVWYAFRPATSGTVYVSVTGAAIWDFKEQHYVATTTYGVYTGASRESLTQIPPSGRSVRIDAEAGQTYWIAVGSPVPEPNYQPIPVRVDLSPPP